jgi:hypothetical protein
MMADVVLVREVHGRSHHDWLHVRDELEVDLVHDLAAGLLRQRGRTPLGRGQHDDVLARLVPLIPDGRRDVAGGRGAGRADPEPRHGQRRHQALPQSRRASS